MLRLKTAFFGLILLPWSRDQITISLITFMMKIKLLTHISDQCHCLNITLAETRMMSTSVYIAIFKKLLYHNFNFVRYQESKQFWRPSQNHEWRCSCRLRCQKMLLYFTQQCSDRVLELQTVGMQSHSGWWEALLPQLFPTGLWFMMIARHIIATQSYSPIPKPSPPSQEVTRSLLLMNSYAWSCRP